MAEKTNRPAMVIRPLTLGEKARLIWATLRGKVEYTWTWHFCCNTFTETFGQVSQVSDG